MKTRDFNKTLRSCSSKGKLDLSKLQALDEPTRLGLAHYILQERGPILVELAVLLGEKLLGGHGYHYTSCVGPYRFRHTAEWLGHHPS